MVKSGICFVNEKLPYQELIDIQTATNYNDQNEGGLENDFISSENESTLSLSSSSSSITSESDYENEELYRTFSYNFDSDLIDNNADSIIEIHENKDNNHYNEAKKSDIESDIIPLSIINRENNVNEYESTYIIFILIGFLYCLITLIYITILLSNKY